MHQFLIARLKNPRTPNLGVLLHNSFLCCFTTTTTTTTTTSSVSVTVTNTFTNSISVSKLISSCGLSPESSLRLSKRLQSSKKQDKPNAVLNLLRKYGFSDSQLSTLIRKHPLVLLAKPETTLSPKLEFLRSVGVSIDDLPGFLIGNVSFLTMSLNRSMVPRFKIIRSFVRSDQELVKTLRHGSRHVHTAEVITDSVPNIELLRKLGLPQNLISLLVTNFPGVAFMKHSRFVEAVEMAKEMGFDPLKSNFVLALQVHAKMSKAMWDSRLELFKRWGWSRDLCVLAFKKYPQFMLISEKKITKTMNFLTKDMGLDAVDIARSPGILNRNMEKTLVPRCAVVELLKKRGLVKNDLCISSFIVVSEKRFLDKFVNKFLNAEPRLLEVYKDAHKPN